MPHRPRVACLLMRELLLTDLPGSLLYGIIYYQLKHQGRVDVGSQESHVSKEGCGNACQCGEPGSEQGLRLGALVQLARCLVLHLNVLGLIPPSARFFWLVLPNFERHQHMQDANSQGNSYLMSLSQVPGRMHTTPLFSF